MTNKTVKELVERLGYHHEHPVSGKLVLRNPDGPEAATTLTQQAAENEALKRLLGDLRQWTRDGGCPDRTLALLSEIDTALTGGGPTDE